MAPATAVAALAPPPTPSFDVGQLLSLCSGLGGVKKLSNGAVCYVAEEDALECLLDIQRFLRRDEPATRDVVCKLAEWNTLRQHVVPLLVTYASKFDLLFNATKVRRDEAHGAAVLCARRGLGARVRLRACQALELAVLAGTAHARCLALR